MNVGQDAEARDDLAAHAGMNDTNTMSQDRMIDTQSEQILPHNELILRVHRKLVRLRSTFHEFEDAYSDIETYQGLLYAEGVIDRALDAFLEF